MEIVSERIIGDSRYYADTDGTEYLSVTSLLSEYSDKTTLIKWRERIGDEEANAIVEQAKEIGKKAHAQIENYFDDDTLLVEDIYAKRALSDFYSRVELLKCEEVVSYVDENTGAAYAGRYDQLVYIPSESFIYQEHPEIHVKPGNYLADLKTKRRLPSLSSYPFYVKHLLQGSAYFNAIRDIDIAGFVMVCVGKRKSRLFMIDTSLLEYYWSLYERMLIDYYGDRKHIKTFWNEFVNKPMEHITHLQQFVSYQPYVILPAE